jgi:hypothetical protein
MATARAVRLIRESGQVDGGAYSLANQPDDRHRIQAVTATSTTQIAGYVLAPGAVAVDVLSGLALPSRGPGAVCAWPRLLSQV